MDQFTYLGGVISSDGSCERDIGRRIGLATGVVSSLSSIWASKELSQQTKIRVYQTLVLSILTYNSETWTLKVTDMHRLRVFEMAVLRRICGVGLRDRWRNEDIKGRLGISEDIVRIIQRKRLTYFGHVVRMENDRIPKLMIDGRLHGTRPQGRPRKKWIDGIMEDCNEMDISLIQAIRSAEDRNLWRSMVTGLSRCSLESQRH